MLAVCARVVRPGAFVVVNAADILVFPDPAIPFSPLVNAGARRAPVTQAQVVEARAAHPQLSRAALARRLGVSEQTVHRRLEGNAVRNVQGLCMTRLELTCERIVRLGAAFGLYLYDQRIWHKPPAWATSRWHGSTYRAVDEYERLLVLRRPGPTEFDRGRLTRSEWASWGSRAVWPMASVRSRRAAGHPASFPVALAERAVRLWSAPGDLVLDPFCGTGACGVAALSHRRRFAGVELDGAWAARARERCAGVAGAVESADLRALGAPSP